MIFSREMKEMTRLMEEMETMSLREEKMLTDLYVMKGTKLLIIIL
jgi:hypothetical protein